MDWREGGRGLDRRVMEGRNRERELCGVGRKGVGGVKVAGKSLCRRWCT